MAIAVLWLVFGYIAPSTSPGTSPKETSHSFSNMNFGELVSTFLGGVALVVVATLVGALVARLWPQRKTGENDQ